MLRHEDGERIQGATEQEDPIGSLVIGRQPNMQKVDRFGNFSDNVDDDLDKNDFDTAV